MGAGRPPGNQVLDCVGVSRGHGAGMNVGQDHEVGQAAPKLADRMRALEPVVSVGDGEFLVIRCDGRSFSNYTSSLTRPFDAQFTADMCAAAAALLADVDGAVLAYTQSDEISVVATRPTERSQWWFNGSLTKVVSVAAARVTAEFNQLRPGRPALFDARAFTCTADELALYLRWRQLDASRNAVSMLARQYLGHRATERVPTGERIRMLAEAGIDVDAFDPVHRFGVLRSAQRTSQPHSFVHRRTGETVTLDSVDARVWSDRPAPPFTPELVAELVERSRRVP